MIERNDSAFFNPFKNMRISRFVRYKQPPFARTKMGEIKIPPLRLYLLLSQYRCPLRRVGEQQEDNRADNRTEQFDYPPQYRVPAFLPGLKNRNGDEADLPDSQADEHASTRLTTIQRGQAEENQRDQDVPKQREPPSS